MPQLLVGTTELIIFAVAILGIGYFFPFLIWILAIAGIVLITAKWLTSRGRKR